MRALVGLAFAASLASCVKTNAFKCEDDSACTGDGARCESDGLCSVSVSTDVCPSGHQYSDTAGDNANQCVGGDAPVDGPPDDGEPIDGDPPPVGCPANFAQITEGQQGHKYHVITTDDPWLVQFNACNDLGSYLAIPDTATELGAIFAHANLADVWVGVSDRITEQTFIDSLGQPYTALTPGGNKGGEDCVQTKDGNALDVINCDDARIAVCECTE